jgi:hypothetical protein
MSDQVLSSIAEPASSKNQFTGKVMVTTNGAVMGREERALAIRNVR